MHEILFALDSALHIVSNSDHPQARVAACALRRVRAAVEAEFVHRLKRNRLDSLLESHGRSTAPVRAAMEEERESLHRLFEARDELFKPLDHEHRTLPLVSLGPGGIGHPDSIEIMEEDWSE